MVPRGFIGGIKAVDTRQTNSSEQPEVNEPKYQNVRSVIGHVWERARINAFAHRAAAEEASKSARRYFVAEFGCALLSIFFVILVYFMSTLIPTHNNVSVATTPPSTTMYLGLAAT